MLQLPVWVEFILTDRSEPSLPTELNYSNTDSIIYSIKRGAKVDIPYHPTQFISFSSEVKEGEEMTAVTVWVLKTTPTRQEMLLQESQSERWQK